MAERTFGWVQEAYRIDKLKTVVQLFLPGSDANRMLREDKIPRLVPPEYGRDRFLSELAGNVLKIPYAHLKGRGVPRGYSRGNAPCSGIVQAALPGRGREYQSDWPADSFLRWAISVGFLDYCRDDDTCALSRLGERYARAKEGGAEETECLTQALLSYPPLCRVLLLLEKNLHMTKFEIGEQLGFIGEAGFTSIPQHLILQGLSETAGRRERNKLLSDTEGTSDKYARTICSWLIQMGWAAREEKSVREKAGKRVYEDVIAQSYRVTLSGRTVAKRARGTSTAPRVPKRVLWEMLATKAAGKEYLRDRRTWAIRCLCAGYKAPEDVALFLKGKGFDEDRTAVLDDIRSFENIGLRISQNRDAYKIADTVIGLEIPHEDSRMVRKPENALVKDKIRNQLSCIDHKYLILIDLAFDSDSNRDFEIQTAELLTRELGFQGARLGEARKPDVCVSCGEYGLIIDNKAYGGGYPLPMSQADEMVRYLEENRARDGSINPNQWWEVFDPGVAAFRYAFVSGAFTGRFEERLQNIYRRTGVPGAAVSVANLLLLAERVKSGAMDRRDFFRCFQGNREIEAEACREGDLDFVSREGLL